MGLLPRRFTAGLAIILLLYQCGCSWLGPSTAAKAEPAAEAALEPFLPQPPFASNITPLPADVEQCAWSNRASIGEPVLVAAKLTPITLSAAELALDAVIHEVLERNPNVTQMVAAWQAATARYPQATALDDPSLDMTVAPASIGSNSVEFGGRVAVNQKFPLGGKPGLRGQVALAEANAASEEINEVRLLLIESAANAFYEYFFVCRAQAVNDESLGLLKEARQSAENRVSTGKASQQEVIQIDVEIGKQKERVLTLERMRQVAVARLNTLMHKPPATPLLPPPGTLPPPTPLPTVEVLRGRALETRPELRAVANRLAGEESGLELAHREYLPDLMAGVAYDSIMGNGPMRDMALQVNVGVNIPLQQGKRHAAVGEAEAKITQRRAEIARLVDQVNFQVQEGYALVEESEKVVELYDKTILPAAVNNVKAAGNAYAAGQIPLLSLLEAQRNVVSLRDRYFQGLAEYHQRRAALERAVGGMPP